jgi:hypothetical protein
MARPSFWVSRVGCTKAMTGFTLLPPRAEPRMHPHFLIHIIFQKYTGDFGILWKSGKTINIRNQTKAQARHFFKTGS